MSGASQFVSISFTVQWELNILQTLPLWCGEASSTSIIYKWCYGNASTRKRTNKEMDQKVTFGPFPSFSKIPQKLKSFEGYPNIFDPFPIYLRLTRFPFFFFGFRILQVRFWCLEKVINFQFADWFLFFYDRFLHILGLFSVCWLVSCFFQSVSANFGPFPVINL